MRNYHKSLILKKLSSPNVRLVILLNLLLPLLTYLFSKIVLEFQMSRNFIDSVGTDYYNRMVFLCLLLDILILSIIDYFFILHPIRSLESLVEQYKKIAQIEDEVIYDRYFTKSSLEKMFLDMLNVQKQVQERNRQAEAHWQETELLALQTQINPHFLYNTLDSIRGLALIHGVKEIADMTEALSMLFRNMISKVGQLLSLKEEFENVNNYILLQQFRFNNKFNYHCQVEEEIQENYLIPNLTLQPIIENAIMHGLERKNGKGTLTVSGYTTQKRLVISVTDDGVGIREEKLELLNRKLRSRGESDLSEFRGRGIGIAMVNISQRIKLQFGDIYGITVFSTPDVSTTVEVVLPLISVRQQENRG